MKTNATAFKKKKTQTRISATLICVMTRKGLPTLFTWTVCELSRIAEQDHIITETLCQDNNSHGLSGKCFNNTLKIKVSSNLMAAALACV